jgi:hypothetical protein
VTKFNVSYTADTKAYVINSATYDAIVNKELIFEREANGFSYREIGEGAFSNSVFKKVSLPSSVKKINKDAFAGCTSLESIVIPEGVTEIEAGAFWECSNLETIYFPTTLTTFGEDVFDACDGLKQVVIPNNVKVISPFLFFNCKYLKEISLPASIEVLGKSCFAYCIRLNTVYYMGTIEQWNAIEKEDTWSDGTRGFNVICTDGEIEY